MDVWCDRSSVGAVGICGAETKAAERFFSRKLGESFLKRPHLRSLAIARARQFKACCCSWSRTHCTLYRSLDARALKERLERPCQKCLGGRSLRSAGWGCWGGRGFLLLGGEGCAPRSSPPQRRRPPAFSTPKRGVQKRFRNTPQLPNRTYIDGAIAIIRLWLICAVLNAIHGHQRAGE